MIGQEFDVSAKYLYKDYLVASMGVGHLFPGAVLLANRHGAAQTIAYLGITHRFRIDKVAVKVK